MIETGTVASEGVIHGLPMHLPLAGRTIQVQPGQTILAAALAQGVDYPYICRSGRCGSCKSRLVSGSVTLLPHARFALSEQEKASGLILACRATPQTEVTVTWNPVELTNGNARRRIVGLVTAVSLATHDILRVHVTLGDEDFRFSAGQYVKLTFGKRLSRDYSIASVPGSRELEFHIRRVESGRVSSFVHEKVWVGDRVAVEGPFGTSYLRPLHTGPILAVAGGSGLAPIRSIVETALASGMSQPIRLYFGAREQRDVYDLSILERLAQAYPNFSYQIVLSRIDAHDTFRTGQLNTALSADLASLEGWKAYVAGPPGMVEAVAEAAFTRGLTSDDFHADIFFTPEAAAA